MIRTILPALFVSAVLASGAPAHAHTGAGSGTAAVSLAGAAGFDTLSFMDETSGCAGGQNIITCTYDGGASWRQTLLPAATVSQIQLVDPPFGWAVIAGGLWESYSTGRYWSWHPEKFTFSSVDFVNHQFGWAVSAQGQLLATRNGGIIFKVVNTPDHVAGLDFLNQTTGWIFGRGGQTLFTNNAGKSWSGRWTLAVQANFGAAQLHMVSMISGWLLLPDQACGKQMPYAVYHTNDGARHWSLRATGPSSCRHPAYPARSSTPSGFVGNLSALDANSAVLAVTNLATSRFYALRTSDAGLHWSQTNPLKRTLKAASLAIDFPSSLAGWAVTGDETGSDAIGHILHTVDGGLTWHTQLVVRQ